MFIIFVLRNAYYISKLVFFFEKKIYLLRRAIIRLTMQQTATTLHFQICLILRISNLIYPYSLLSIQHTHVGFKHWIKIKPFSTTKTNGHFSSCSLNYLLHQQPKQITKQIDKKKINHCIIIASLSRDPAAIPNQCVCFISFITNAQNWQKSFNHTCAICSFKFIMHLSISTLPSKNNESEICLVFSFIFIC